MRLLKKHKAAILERTFDLLIKPKVEKEQQWQRTLGTELYNTVVTPEQQRIMKQLPADFFQTHATINLRPNLQQYYTEYDFSLPAYFGATCGGYRRDSLSMEDAIMPQHLVHGCVVVDELPAEWKIKFKNAHQRAERIRIAYQKLYSDLRDMLQAVPNLAKLKQAWPDCNRFLPEEVVNPETPNVPAVLVKIHEIEQLLEQGDEKQG